VHALKQLLTILPCVFSNDWFSDLLFAGKLKCADTFGALVGGFHLPSLAQSNSASGLIDHSNHCDVCAVTPRSPSLLFLQGLGRSVFLRAHFLSSLLLGRISCSGNKFTASGTDTWTVTPVSAPTHAETIVLSGSPRKSALLPPLQCYSRRPNNHCQLLLL
jgi:hypothetical protein